MTLSIHSAEATSVCSPPRPFQVHVADLPRKPRVPGGFGPNLTEILMPERPHQTGKSKPGPHCDARKDAPGPGAATTAPEDSPPTCPRTAGPRQNSAFEHDSHAGGRTLARRKCPRPATGDDVKARLLTDRLKTLSDSHCGGGIRSVHSNAPTREASYFFCKISSLYHMKN